MSSDELSRLLNEFKERDLAPILYGAIAVCESWSFTTDKVIFNVVVDELKQEEVPDRFRVAIDSVFIHCDPNLPASDEVDDVFRNLGWLGDNLGYIYDDRRGGPAPFCGLRFIWSDENASKYVGRQGFTEQELDWLWSVALRLHSYEGSVPVRRSL